ncbi:hypothetical protein CY0110_18992 [Crocosphaera chwakensis CCY0110]|uniref:Uncharacterized protein n=1 Tax=Crocosphaera chwakensis CCY0110 TaxID=391612 RepID=A3IJD0_9CHRO|nr:hypothetical protein CY0110_18992 [Crocosphaera chwakensis CCY0110]
MYGVLILNLKSLPKKANIIPVNKN